jgi:hypothetical protein
MQRMRLWTMTMLAAAAGPAWAACSVTTLCPTSPPPPDPDVCVITGTHTLDDGCVLDFGTDGIIVHNNAKVQVADGDRFTLRAGSITIRGTAQARGGRLTLVAVGGNGNDANTGQVRTEKVSNSPGKIDVRDGGLVTMTASGDVHLLGQDVNADGGSAYSGGLVVATGTAITATSPIHANGQNGGDGGFIHLEATGNVALEGPVEAAGEGAGTGQIPGYGGSITILAGGSLSLDQELLAFGELGGDGGDVALAAGGAATLDHNINVNGTGGTAGADGGTIDIAIGSGTIAGDLTATASSEARGGNVRIRAESGNVTASNASVINVSGGGNGGEGGHVEVHGVGNVTVNGPITANAAGTSSAGGEVTIYARGTLTVGAAIEARSTTSNGAQSGAIIDLTACAIAVNGHLKTRNPTGSGQNRIQYVTSLTGSNVQILSDDPEGNQIVCGCTDGNSDGACDTQACTYAPSFTNVTQTPTPSYAFEPLTCG